MSRVSLVIACVSGTLWLGGNIALAVSAMQVFSLVGMSAIDASHAEAGEIFGVIFMVWTCISLGLLAVMTLAHVTLWYGHLRRGRPGFATWLSLAGFLLLAASSLAGFRAVFDSDAAYDARDRAQTDAERQAAHERFTTAHQVSMTWNRNSTLVLMGVVVGLAIALARSKPALPSPANV